MDDRLRRDRKYKSFWGVFLFGTVAMFFDKLTGADWVEVTIYVFGLYMLGNGVEHGAAAWKDKQS